jgi:hypothetical protein
MKSFWKTYTFWISVCAWLITMGGQYSGAIPAPYGLIVGNTVAVVYTVMRCLQKRQAGIPWKGIFFTSEFLGTGATVLVNLLESIKDVPSLSPRVLAILSVTIVGLGSLLHTLGGTSAASGVPVVPASEAVTKVEELGRGGSSIADRELRKIVQGEVEQLPANKSRGA